MGILTLIMQDIAKGLRWSHAYRATSTKLLLRSIMLGVPERSRAVKYRRPGTKKFRRANFEPVKQRPKSQDH